MSKNEEVNNTLEQVDIRRRGFLNKLLAGGAAAAAIPAMSTVVLGQGAGPGGGKGKGGKGKGGQAGKGKGGAGGGRPDPKQMAAILLKQHDKDGDGALNQAELTAAITAMMERRAGGQGKGAPGGGGAGKGKGGAGKGKGGAGKGKAGGDGAGGGVRPARPESE